VKLVELDGRDDLSAVPVVDGHLGVDGGDVEAVPQGAGRVGWLGRGIGQRVEPDPDKAR
jgi:hypothetical protein